MEHDDRTPITLDPDDEAAILKGLSEISRNLSRRDFLERDTGIEPATCSLGSCHSTTELVPQKTRIT